MSLVMVLPAAAAIAVGGVLVARAGRRHPGIALAEMDMAQGRCASVGTWRTAPVFGFECRGPASYPLRGERLVPVQVTGHRVVLVCVYCLEHLAGPVPAVPVSVVVESLREQAEPATVEAAPVGTGAVVLAVAGTTVIGTLAGRPAGSLADGRAGAVSAVLPSTAVVPLPRPGVGR